MITDILLNIALLTLLFGAASGGALLMRRKLMRGSENIMCAIWAAVLIISAFPIYNSAFAVSLPVAGETVVEYIRPSLSDKSEIPTADTSGGTSAGMNASAVSPSDTAAEIPAANNGQGDISETTAAGYTQGNQNAKGLFTGETLSVLAAAASILLFCVWATGVTVMLVRAADDYNAARKALDKASDECADARVNGVFDSCRFALEMNTRPALRIVRRGCTCSPCTAGIIHPSVYIGEECLRCGDIELNFIFMHELCHIKRHDMLFKLFALTVTSLHWFNPVSGIVRRAISEDCELACDSKTLSLLGRQMSDSYMYTILDIAERLCRSRQPAITENLGAGLFMNGGAGKKFLERRYGNMKNIKKNKFALAASALFIILSFAANAVIMSSCALPADAKGGASSSGYTVTNGSTGNIFIDEMIRGCYDMTDSEPITQELADGITSLVITVSKYDAAKSEAYSNVTLTDYIVNGKTVSVLPDVIECKRYEEDYIGALAEHYGSGADQSMKFQAFYTLKNINDPLLTEDGIAEMRAIFSDFQSLTGSVYSIEDFADGIYLKDPYATELENERLIGYLNESGVNDDHMLLNGCFDASTLGVLTNLESVAYVGITAVNEALPEGCVSQNEAYIPETKSETESVQSETVQAGTVPAGEAQYGDSKGITAEFKWNGESIKTTLSYGLFELETKGMTVDENGNEYLVFNSKSLQAAIEEYFMLEMGSYTGITPDMLAQITSVEYEFVSGLDYLYDESMELHGGHYIRYTINGVKSGILPEYINYSIPDGYASTGPYLVGMVSDTLFTDGLYEIVDINGGKYYHLICEDEETQVKYFKQLSDIAGMKSLIINSWDEDGDGNPDPVVELSQTSSWIVTMARYANSPIESEETAIKADLAYFPNLG